MLFRSLLAAHPRALVDVLQHLDGQLEVRYQGKSLVTFEQARAHPVRVKKFEPAPGQEITQPVLAQEKPAKTPEPHSPYKPAVNHPWRRYGQTLKGKRLG